MDDTAELARLAQAVRDRRAELDLTQKEAASAAEVSDTTWTAVEAGKPASERTYRGVARALGWTPESPALVRRGEDAELLPDDHSEGRFLASIHDAWIQEITEHARALDGRSLYVVAGVEAWLYWWERETEEHERPDMHDLADFLEDLPDMDFLDQVAHRHVISARDRERQRQPTPEDLLAGDSFGRIARLPEAAKSGDTTGVRGSDPRGIDAPAEQDDV